MLYVWGFNCTMTVWEHLAADSHCNISVADSRHALDSDIGGHLRLVMLLCKCSQGRYPLAPLVQRMNGSVSRAQNDIEKKW